MNRGRWSHSKYKPLQNFCKRCKSTNVEEVKYFAEGTQVGKTTVCNECDYMEGLISENKTT